MWAMVEVRWGVVGYCVVRWWCDGVGWAVVEVRCGVVGYYGVRCGEMR